jgi:hypothetical protein
VVAHHEHDLVVNHGKQDEHDQDVDHVKRGLVVDHHEQDLDVVRHEQPQQAVRVLDPEMNLELAVLVLDHER